MFPPLNSKNKVKIPKDKWKDFQDIKPFFHMTVTIIMAFFFMQISPTDKIRRRKKKKLVTDNDWKIENKASAIIFS